MNDETETQFYIAVAFVIAVIVVLARCVIWH
jgi:hypothetical protein